MYVIILLIPFGITKRNLLKKRIRESKIKRKGDVVSTYLVSA